MNDQTHRISIFWHRRDLRLEDNHGLYQALSQSGSVQPIFIFDTEILDELPKSDQRVAFIEQAVQRLNAEYSKRKKGGVWVFYGKPIDVFKQILDRYDVASVYCNRDYEPYAIKRDREIWSYLKEQNVAFKGFKDHVIFEKLEIAKDDGTPYQVFTPYSKKWKQLLKKEDFQAFPVDHLLSNLNTCTESYTEFASNHGFQRLTHELELSAFDQDLLVRYAERRDFPGLDATTRMSVYIRFGIVSIRECVRQANQYGALVWLNELIWRDFYQMILFNYPHVIHSCFKEKYEKVNWENREDDFDKWCTGSTGYPIVDAGMRELNQTGFMHNRVRMIVASFLTKHLLIDWRWGEAYFAEKLMDFDLAANNGGWQWAAGCGADAAPYFRVFNPTIQAQKFDREQRYIRRWVQELDELTYPQAMIDHKYARKRAIERFKAALESN